MSAGIYDAASKKSWVCMPEPIVPFWLFQRVTATERRIRPVAIRRRRFATADIFAAAWELVELAEEIRHGRKPTLQRTATTLKRI